MKRVSSQPAALQSNKVTVASTREAPSRSPVTFLDFAISAVGVIENHNGPFVIINNSFNCNIINPQGDSVNITTFGSSYESHPKAISKLPTTNSQWQALYKSFSPEQQKELLDAYETIYSGKGTPEAKNKVFWGFINGLILTSSSNNVTNQGQKEGENNMSGNNSGNITVTNTVGAQQTQPPVYYYVGRPAQPVYAAPQASPAPILQATPAISTIPAIPKTDINSHNRHVNVSNFGNGNIINPKDGSTNVSVSGSSGPITVNANRQNFKGGPGSTIIGGNMTGGTIAPIDASNGAVVSGRDANGASASSNSGNASGGGSIAAGRNVEGVKISPSNATATTTNITALQNSGNKATTNSTNAPKSNTNIGPAPQATTPVPNPGNNTPNKPSLPAPGPQHPNGRHQIPTPSLVQKQAS